MNLSKILLPAAVRVISQTTSKKRLFQELGDVAFAAYGLNASSATDALQERESLGPTGVGHGIALPHARLSGVRSVLGAFIKLEKPLEFDAVDRQPVDLVFALFAPEEAGVDHLKALALVSRTMRDAALCTKLRANYEPATLHALITGSPASQAA